MNNAETLTYWTEYMHAQDLTELTIRNRLQLMRYVGRTIGEYTTITRHDLITFMGSHTTWSSATRVHYRSALHTFFTWLQDEEFRLDNPASRLPKVKGRRHDPNPVPVQDIQRMLNGGSYRKTRWMVALHYYLGLRVSEIARIHGDDIDWDNRTLRVLTKGATVKTKAIPDALWVLAQEWPKHEYLFPNWTDNRLYKAGEGHILGNSVSRQISDLMKRSGVTGHRPHDLRAATATEQNAAGVPSLVIQENLGHASMATTSIYTRVDIEQRRDGLNMLPVVDIPTRSMRRHRGLSEAA